MTLYLKYRPQTIDELDLENVREAFTRLLGAKEIPHAFLFAGPKGTGKTSAARILAKIVNCEKNTEKFGPPCNKCEGCLAVKTGRSLDVIELDAASHRGIDDIRALRENIILSPVSGRKKIYIIDEAHMLTTEAANAFLKTLEEPPDHALFVFATTDPHKLPATVRSRLTQINFQKATAKELERQLTRVIKGEALKVEPEALKLIIKAADGSFRDAVKILEQASFDTKTITRETLEKSLSFQKKENIEAFFGFLAQKEIEKALSFIEELVNQGVEIKSFTDALFERLHQAILAKQGFEESEDLKNLSLKEVLSLVDLLAQVRDFYFVSPIAQLPLQIAVIRWIGLKKKPKTNGQIKEKVVLPQNPNLKLPEGIWQKIISTTSLDNSSISALLRASKPIDFDGTTLTLGVFYQFHKEKLEVPQYTRMAEGIIGDILGSPVRLVCILTEPPKKIPDKSETVLTESQDKDIIESAKEIFT